jgi:hypothetical protein
MACLPGGTTALTTPPLTAPTALAAALRSCDLPLKIHAAGALAAVAQAAGPASLPALGGVEGLVSGLADLVQSSADALFRWGEEEEDDLVDGGGWKHL